MAFLTRLWRKRLISLEVPIPIRGGAFNYAATMLQMQYRVVDEFADRPRVVLQAKSHKDLRKAYKQLSAFVEMLVDELTEDAASEEAFIVDNTSQDSPSAERLSWHIEDDFLGIDSRPTSPLSDFSCDL